MLRTCPGLKYKPYFLGIWVEGRQELKLLHMTQWVVVVGKKLRSHSHVQKLCHYWCINYNSPYFISNPLPSVWSLCPIFCSTESTFSTVGSVEGSIGSGEVYLLIGSIIHFSRIHWEVLCHSLFTTVSLWHLGSPCPLWAVLGCGIISQADSPPGSLSSSPDVE